MSADYTFDLTKARGYKEMLEQGASSQLPGAKNGGLITQLAELLSPAIDVMKTKPATINAQRGAIKSAVEGLGNHVGRLTPEAAKLQSRMAGAALRSNPLLRAGLKFGGPLAAGLAVGDIIMGDESLGNKAMDTAMMVGGGALGSFIPVVGTSIGAALGKGASDATQAIFGGGKSAEERKMEEALLALRGGMI